MTPHVFLRCSVGLALSVGLFAQAGRPSGPGAGAGTPTAPSPTNPTRPGVGTQPGNTPGNYPTPDIMQRPLFFTGKVMMEDGTPPSDSVTIQLVCRGTPRSVAFTDSKGNFSVDLNNRINDASLMDASQPAGGGFGGPFGGSSGSRMGAQGNSSGMNERDLMGCDMQAALAGFTSEQIHLGTRHGLDNPDVGTILLHRLANVEGLTISATSALAPKDAKKAFEKGREVARKQKWDEAEKDFQKAVDLYPKYAAAWFQLGLVQQEKKNDEGARKSYAQALAADSKFVSPYQQLAMLAAREQKWQEVIDDTDRLLRLNPVDFPQAWLFNSLGNYYLKNLAVAEKSAREGISRDAAHHYATMNHVLGVILAQKQDYAGAAEQLRDYIHFAPNATDIDQVKQQLAEIDKVLGPQAKKQDSEKQ
ncbi:MAG TPA: tetratricopeptide repeat protein [Bryobacteraceae bacterium]|nr:tetratricopeptide repeat protein [Bryobacteraceae bacterium]